MHPDYYLKSFYRSFFLRVGVNISFLFVVHLVMLSTIDILPEFIVDITRIPQNGADMFATASYLFDETSILVTLAGLVLVALMSLQVGIGFFTIVPGEELLQFRIRLFLYSISSLVICCIITLYLFFIVGIMSSISSHRIGEHNSFVWTYPFYAIVILFYVTELYGFLTKNSMSMAKKEVADW